MPQIKQFIACKNAKTATVKPFCEIKNITDTTADLYFYGDIVSDWWGAWQDEDHIGCNQKFPCRSKRQRFKL